MSADSLANFFIDKSIEEGKGLNNYRLQLISYIAYGWVLATLNEDLTDGEGFQAWDVGPIMPSVYHQLKHLRSESIDNLAVEYYFEENHLVHRWIKNKDTLHVLNKVWAIYKGFSTKNLKAEVRKKGSPWEINFDRAHQFNVIDKDEVKYFYAKEIESLINSVKVS